MSAADPKQMARATWAAGDYDAIVDYIWGVGADLVARVGVGPEDRVLDVACGTGNATIPAAATGARTVGLDLTPELLDGARRRAQSAGVDVEWVEGDAEALPFEDGSFDIVLSSFGCMFAPRHDLAAAELVRVLKPGGRMGVAAWTPDGAVGDFFRSTASLAPPPPPGFQPPILWGERGHVSGLFANTDAEVRFEDAAVRFEFDSLDGAVEEYSANFGPVVMLRALLEPQGRGDEVRAAVRDAFERADSSPGEGVAYDAAYLVTLGEKRA